MQGNYEFRGRGSCRGFQSDLEALLGVSLHTSSIDRQKNAERGDLGRCLCECLCSSRV